MQIHNFSYRIRGFLRLADYAIRWEDMVSEKGKHKARVLSFWARHGLEATEEAFGVKRRTLYYWRSQLIKGGGKLEALSEGSKAPHRRRKRSWPGAVSCEIRRLRTEHPNLSKEKVYLALKPFCDSRGLCCPKPRTVGRIIAQAPDKMRTVPMKIRPNGQRVTKKAKRERKPKGFKASSPGHCGAFDTVELFLDGLRRYVITFTDLYSRFSFAWATKSHGSEAAREVFKVVSEVFPYPLEHVLTDNGSEFMKHFDEELRRLHKVHWHTYPKTPKMNAHAERFNRTLQEEFLDYHEDLLVEPRDFNQKLIPWLLWYNGERPHWGLKLKSPVQFLMEQKPEECKMWWPNTCACLPSKH